MLMGQYEKSPLLAISGLFCEFRDAPKRSANLRSCPPSGILFPIATESGWGGRLTDPEHFHALPKGYRFEDYEIVRVLGQGGFGITYLGYHHALDKPVAIKEYLPDGLAVRDATDSVVPKAASMAKDFEWGLDRFLEEARTLAQFSHPNLIRVEHFFRANGTAYIVMEYAEGETLAELLGRRQTLSKDELWRIMDPLLDGLEALHVRRFMHRDIKPANIIIRDDGAPVLIDFGAARQAVGSKSQTLTAIVTPRFAPLEQYSSDGNQGPWTDIYAMSAVAYKVITGKLPPDPTQRMPKDPYVSASELAADQTPEAFLKAIDWALAVFGDDRPQNIGQWREALEGGEVMEEPAPKERVAAPKRPEPKKEKAKSRTGLYWGVVVVLLVAIGGAASYYNWPTPGELGSTPDPAAAEKKPVSMIEEAQGLLNRLGYEVGPPDGVFSARTEAAVRKFEIDQRLFEVGEVDALLIEKLKAELTRRDEAAWQAALRVGSKAAFEAYRSAWPDGRYVEEIEATRHRLDWEKAKAANTVPAFEAYRAAWPKGAHVAEVDEEIARIKIEQAEALRKAEQVAWRLAEAEGTAEAYRRYLKDYPNGTHTKEARLKFIPFDLTWEKIFGGSEWDWVDSIVALTNGGFVAASYTDSKGAGKLDAWILRLDKTGELLWEKTFGGPDNDTVASIAALADGGFVVAGWTEPKGTSDRDAWIFRLDRTGGLLWEKTFGGAEHENATSIVALPDGGFVVAGFTASKGAGESDVWVLRLDKTGELLWEKTFGGPDKDVAASIIALTDGGFVVVGPTKSKGAGSWDVWIFRLDPPK